MSERWIDELNELYKKILDDPQIEVEVLDKANEIICQAIEEIRPLAQVGETVKAFVDAVKNLHSICDKIRCGTCPLNLVRGCGSFVDAVKEGNYELTPRWMRN